LRGIQELGGRGHRLVLQATATKPSTKILVPEEAKLQQQYLVPEEAKPQNQVHELGARRSKVAIAMRHNATIS
jgi:hypothetical protein